MISLVLVADRMSGLAETLASALPLVTSASIVVENDNYAAQRVVAEALMKRSQEERGWTALVRQVPPRSEQLWNMALDLAAERDFALVLRAGETLERDRPKQEVRSALHGFAMRHQETDGVPAGCLVVESQQELLSLETRLVRVSDGWRFAGRAREVLVPHPVTPRDDVVWDRILGVRVVSPEPTREQLYRDAEALQAELTLNGRRPRTVLLLAKTWDALERQTSRGRVVPYALRTPMGYAKAQDAAVVAEELYEERLKMPTKTPADYLALMWFADFKRAQGDITRARTLYHAAHLRFPDRAEPFHRLALIDRAAGLDDSALIHAQRGLAVPEPSVETAPFELEPDVYRYRLAALAGEVAMRLGKWDVAVAAYERAIAGIHAVCTCGDPRFANNCSFELKGRYETALAEAMVRQAAAAVAEDLADTEPPPPEKESAP